MKKKQTFAQRAKKTIKSKKFNILSAELGDTWSNKEANPEHNKGGFIIRWVCKDIGFGELTFYYDPKGKLICDTECMSKDFVVQVMDHFLNSIELK